MLILCCMQCDGAALCVLAAHHPHHTGAGEDDGNKHHTPAGQGWSGLLQLAQALHRRSKQ